MMVMMMMMEFVPVNRNICQFEIAECCPDILGMESFDHLSFDHLNIRPFNDKFDLSTQIFVQKAAQFYLNILQQKHVPRSPFMKCFIFEQKSCAQSDHPYH